MALKFYRYTVSGRGKFPLNMLHIDECWPTKISDVVAVGPASASNRFNFIVRQVQLSSNRAPSLNFWADYGWKVLEHVYERVEEGV